MSKHRLLAIPDYRSLPTISTYMYQLHIHNTQPPWPTAIIYAETETKMEVELPRIVTEYTTSSIPTALLALHEYSPPLIRPTELITKVISLSPGAPPMIVTPFIPSINNILSFWKNCAVGPGTPTYPQPRRSSSLRMMLWGILVSLRAVTSGATVCIIGEVKKKVSNYH